MSNSLNIKFRGDLNRPLTWDELDINFNESKLIITEFNSFYNDQYVVFYNAQVIKNDAYDAAVTDFAARIAQNELDISNLGDGGDVAFNSIVVNDITINNALVIDSDVLVSGTVFLTNLDLAGDAEIAGDVNITQDLDVTGTATLGILDTVNFTLDTRNLIGLYETFLPATGAGFTLSHGIKYRLENSNTYTLPESGISTFNGYDRPIILQRIGSAEPVIDCTGSDVIITPAGSDTSVLVDTNRVFYFFEVSGGWEVR